MIAQMWTVRWWATTLPQTVPEDSCDVAPNVKEQLAGFDPNLLRAEREEFAQLLDSSKREEETQRFIATHQHILAFTFAPLGRPVICVPKYRLGSEYVPDFMLLYDTSFRVIPVFIELEPAFETFFTKRGTEAKRLRDAKLQIADWYGWLRTNWDYFARNVHKEFRSGLSGPGEYAHNCVDFKIVIGRRRFLDDHQNRKRLIDFDMHHGDVEIVTYDRFLDAYDYVTALFQGTYLNSTYGYQSLKREIGP